jgi:hypothetical protein
LKGIAVGGIVAALPWDAVACEPSVGAHDAGGAPWALLSPFKRGDSVGLGWHLDDLSDVQRGALVLRLVHQDGRSAEVHICERQDGVRGIARTARFDVLLMNGGDGTVVTSESVGRVVKTLAVCIAHNESAIGELSGLLPHPDRVSRFGPPRHRARILG